METDSRSDLAGALSAALRARLGEIVAADERRRSFVVEPGESPPDDVPADEASVLRDLVLRALAAASDPVNYAILRRLAREDASLAELASLAGIPRLAVSERVDDLLQVGLVGRTLRGDGAGATPAGRALVEVVEACVEG